MFSKLFSCSSNNDNQTTIGVEKERKMELEIQRRIDVIVKDRELKLLDDIKLWNEEKDKRNLIFLRQQEDWEKRIRDEKNDMENRELKNHVWQSWLNEQEEKLNEKIKQVQEMELKLKEREKYLEHREKNIDLIVLEKFQLAESSLYILKDELLEREKSLDLKRINTDNFLSEQTQILSVRESQLRTNESSLQSKYKEIESRESKLEIVEKLPMLSSLSSISSFILPTSQVVEICRLFSTDFCPGIIEQKLHQCSTEFIGYSQYFKKYANLNVQSIIKYFNFKRKIRYEIKKSKMPIHNEAFLYHGTRATDPRAVAREGLDIKHANVNGWLGPGIYGSWTVNYCRTNKFAHHFVPQGSHSRWYVLVVFRCLTGTPYKIFHQSEYKLLPEGYDSIHLNEMYAIYDNDQVDVDCLIYYTE